jgi:hypothetical protein
MSAKFLSAFALSVLVCTMPLQSRSQTIKCGAISYLASSNGFKNILLGNNFNSRLSKQITYLDNNPVPDADSCVTYACSDSDVLTIDSSLKLNVIGIRTYKNKIVNIYLFFAEKDAYKVLSNFLQNYGQYTRKPVEYADIYNWNTQSVSLSLSYNANIDMGVAIFTFKPLAATVQADRRKRDITLASLQASNLN